MKNEEIMPVLTDGLVNKLESIDFEIKCLLNINLQISKKLDDESVTTFKFMNKNELTELNEIRHRIKRLYSNLKFKMHEKR